MFSDPMHESVPSSQKKDDNNTAPKKRSRVALIGCGASGMCFLHALATRHQRGDDVPHVTCFELADAPGGCWRSVTPDQRALPHNQACWYDDIWSNICKECFEFHDYTFQTHFGGRADVPTFLPRKELLDYVIKRTISVDPTLLDADPDHPLVDLRYSTMVTHVSFDEDTMTFTVVSAPYNATAATAETTATATNNTVTDEFDYCIWAAGIRGKPRIPRSLLSLFKTGQSIVDMVGCENNVAGCGKNSHKISAPIMSPFQGTILHSTHAAQLKSAMADSKRVILVGDSDSALDLALYGVKCGAQKIYVLSRSGYGDSVYIGSWPTRRVGDEEEVIVQVHVAIPIRVVDDGKSIECARVSWNAEEQFYQLDPDEDSIILNNIDTVIFCTGYFPNTSFLSKDLQLHAEDLYSWCWSAPSDFVMRDNPLTPDLGNVTPSADLNFSGNIMPGVYRTVLLSNPRMMYIMDFNSEYPILHLEAEAWLCLAFCTGDLQLPSTQDMEEEIHQRMLEEMNVSFLRWSMDTNYFESMFDIGEEHWSDDYNDPRTIQLNQEYLRYYVGHIARNLKDAKYPVDFGTDAEHLTDLGEALVKVGLYNVRFRQEQHTEHTYRDIYEPNLKSIFTGQVAAPLPRPWLELTPDETVVVEAKTEMLRK